MAQRYMYVLASNSFRPELIAATDVEDPRKPGQQAYVKIAGILVNSTYFGNEFLLVVGAFPSFTILTSSSRYSPPWVYWTHHRTLQEWV